jgi:hypothetical protein
LTLPQTYSVRELLVAKRKSPMAFRAVKSAVRAGPIHDLGAGQGDVMARITEVLHGLLPMSIHDVTHPVSWKWFCYRDDELLLQYALNKFMAKEKLSDLKGKPTIVPMGREWPPLAPLKVDGIFGNKPMARSRRFKRSGARRSMAMSIRSTHTSLGLGAIRFRRETCRS